MGVRQKQIDLKVALDHMLISQQLRGTPENMRNLFQHATLGNLIQCYPPLSPSFLK